MLLVQHHINVVLRHDNSNRAVLVIGDRFTLDGRLEFASDEVVNVLADVLGVDLGALVERVLLGLGDLLDGEGRPLADFKVEVAGVLAEGFGVDGGDVDLALVLLGDGLDFFGELLTLFWGLGEDVGEWDLGLF